MSPPPKVLETFSGDTLEICIDTILRTHYGIPYLLLSDQDHFIAATEMTRDLNDGIFMDLYDEQNERCKFIFARMSLDGRCKVTITTERVPGPRR